MARISGPLLDRIDIHIEVPAVEFKELSSPRDGTDSGAMREQVEAARRIQAGRFAESRINANAQMSSRQVRSCCQLDDASQGLLKNSVQDLGLSARAHDKILRVARTIADLEASEEVRVEHVSEAINYRMLDRDFWT
jgi:magnesium chelatase family protein